MGLKRGDVVLAAGAKDFGKVRPAVVVQSDALSSEHPSVVVCPMTTALRGLDVRVQVSPDRVNGLERPSEVMVDKITVLTRARVHPAIGRLADADMVAVDRALALLLGLGEAGVTPARSPR